MSQPPPIVIQFAVKGLDDVKKALKSITDVAGGTTQKSKAAAKATTDAQTREVEKGVAKAVATVVEGEKKKTTARKAGLKDAEKVFEAETKAAVKAVEKYTNKIRETRRTANIANENAHNDYFRTIKLKRIELNHSAEQKATKQHQTKLRAEHESHLDSMEQRAKEYNDYNAKLRSDHIVRTHVAEQKAAQQAAKIAPKGVFDDARKALGKPGGNLGPVAAGMDHPLAQLARDIDKNDSPAALAKRMRERASAERYVARLKDSYFREEQRKEEELTELKAREAEKRKKFVMKGIGAGFSTAAGVAKGAIGGAINAAGGFSVVDSIQSEIALQGQAASLSASSPDRTPAKDILSRARSVGIKQGFDPSEVIGGMDAIKKLDGDKMEQAMRVMPMIAQIANATGGDLKELSGFAGNILAGGKEDGKAVNDSELKELLLTMAQQGMSGAVEVGDMARFGSRLTGGASLFTGNKLNNTVSLGAIAQMARSEGTATTPAEATMAALRFGTDIASHADKVEAVVGKGNVMKDGVLRSPEELTMGILRGTGGDVDKLTHVGVNERAAKFLQGAASIYRKNGKGEKGEEAVHQYFEKMRVKMTADELESREKERLLAADKQIASAMLELRTIVATELAPRLVKFINEGLIPALPQIQRLVEGLGKLADFAIKNPLEGLGVLIAGAITAEMAKASLASLLATSVGTALSGATLAIALAYLTVQALNEADKVKDEDAAKAHLAALNAGGSKGDKQITDQAGYDKDKMAAAGLKKSIADDKESADSPSASKYIAYVSAALNDMLSTDPSGETKRTGPSELDQVKEAEAQRAKATADRIAENQKMLDNIMKAMQAFETSAKNAADAMDGTKKPAPGNGNNGPLPRGKPTG